MGKYIDELLEDKRFSAPEGANSEFRSACRSRNRRRAAGHDNAKSLLLMSPNRLARLQHSILRGALAASYLLVLATAAFAQDKPAAFADPASAASSSVARADNETTRIEIDQKTSVIRFVIAGQERAVLDAAGLHVNGDIEFTGQTEDIGEWSNREAAHAP
jgi:hypothetical protein